MKKRKQRPYRLGETISCNSEEHMEYMIKSLAGRGIDAKPTGNFNDIEIVDIDKRGKK